ncbi:MAG: O-antigen ligase family protein, partial [Terracidiphilus sp.]
MPPTLALILCLISLAALLRFDPANEPNISPTLWVPLTWMFFLGSRSPSQWLTGQMGLSAQALEDGNPLDRVVFLVLILLAIGILISRSFKWGSFFARNLALTALISYALVSVLWSDFPFIAFKRWFRDLGPYLVIFVILSDPRPLEAVRTVLRRLSYSLILLSILLNKYFPQLSRQFDSWTGVGFFVGATTTKNMLGLVCLISGLFFFWDTFTRWPDRKQRRTKRIIAVNVVFFLLTIWLLRGAHCTTASICLILGCLVITATGMKVFQRNPRLLNVLIPSSFCLYLILDFGLNLNGSMAQAVGKDPTLTERTHVWAVLLGMHTNPLLGTGYQSFWLGPRLEWFAENSGVGLINEAHNGYLEIYLNLGLVGVALLVGFLVVSYRAICRKLAAHSNLAVFALAAWIGLVFYNMSEAAFQGGLLWMMLLMGAVALPERAKKRVQRGAAFDSAGIPEHKPSLSLETMNDGDSHGYA